MSIYDNTNILVAQDLNSPSLQVEAPPSPTGLYKSVPQRTKDTLVFEGELPNNVPFYIDKIKIDYAKFKASKNSKDHAPTRLLRIYRYWENTSSFTVPKGAQFTHSVRETTGVISSSAQTKSVSESLGVEVTSSATKGTTTGVTTGAKFDWFSIGASIENTTTISKSEKQSKTQNQSNSQHWSVNLSDETTKENEITLSPDVDSNFAYWQLVERIEVCIPDLYMDFLNFTYHRAAETVNLTHNLETLAVTVYPE